VGTSVVDWIAERFRDVFRGMQREAEAGESRREVVLRATSGSEVPALLSMTTYEDAGQRVTCLIAADLREQKRNEEVVASERLNRSVLAQAGDAIVVCDPEGTVILANRAAEELASRNPLYLRFREAFPLVATGTQEPIDLVDAALRGAIARGSPAALERADGSRVDLLANADPLQGSDGSIQGCVVTLSDVTTLRHAEEVLREANRLKNDFLSMASHELRTPLTALRLQAETLARSLASSGLGNERFGQKIAIMLSQCDRLESLVGTLLDVSRITAGKLVLDLSRWDLAELTREVVERFESQAASTGSELTLHASKAEGCWDRTRIDQVVTNLIGNALKYGSGKPVHVTVDEHDRAAWLVVRDQGVGISPESQARIFERFERAANARPAAGLGLGLWIAKQMVDAHGGHITVVSAPGEGSTFTVTLPRTRP
jgi:PAS domain S-box-containing protein